MLGPKNSRMIADRQAQGRATNEDDFKLKEINRSKSDFRGDLCVTSAATSEVLRPWRSFCGTFAQISFFLHMGNSVPTIILLAYITSINNR